jgi:GT2 family glycosyltransferase
MKLSVVILCWNDLKVLRGCLESIYKETTNLGFEVILSDNGSSDGAPEWVAANYSAVRILRNGRNLGFAEGNNVGLRVATGEYVIVLNPDTIVHARAFEKWVAYADTHGEVGAFGCRVLNTDGSFQNPARPFPTVWRMWLAALGLQWLGRIVPSWCSNKYMGWDGRTEREIDRQSGCCLMLRRAVLDKVGLFDNRFFYEKEETDLCFRIKAAGYKILYWPGAEITHLRGQSVSRFPVRFALERERSSYRFFFKHYGFGGAGKYRVAELVHLSLRFLFYRIQFIWRKSEPLKSRLEMYRICIKWNWQLDPQMFIKTGEEPNLGYEPLAAAPKMV